MSVFALNKSALHDYGILETLNAGIVLTGAETKSIRMGQVSLKGSYITVHENEVFLTNAHIPRYKPAGIRAAHDPYRSRKLLLRKKEIAHLVGKLKEKGLTAVPLKVYTSQSRIKIEVGIARGKRTFEKRELIKKREVEREIRTQFKRRDL